MDLPCGVLKPESFTETLGAQRAFLFQDFICQTRKEHKQGSGLPAEPRAKRRDSIPGLQDRNLSGRQTLKPLATKASLLTFISFKTV